LKNIKVGELHLLNMTPTKLDNPVLTLITIIIIIIMRTHAVRNKTYRRYAKGKAECQRV
jgi:hypothetical protein